VIIRLIAKNRSIKIDDSKNFKAFSGRIEGALELVEQDELLGRIAVRYDLEHAWISEQVLGDWPSLKSEAWWRDGLAGLIAAMRKFGWIDNQSRSIRAHFERVSEPTCPTD
jgi:hypothetical protein